MIKTKADCAYDWATVDAVSMATNQELTVDIKRACPEIQATLADDAVDEDSGAYTFSLTNLADDVQDDEATLTWTVTEGTTVAHSNVLVDWDKNGHTVTITPLADQFGTVEFEFIVTDSHGLTDTKNMTLTVNNINDKPVTVTQSVLTVCQSSPKTLDTRTSFLKDSVVFPSSLVTSPTQASRTSVTWTTSRTLFAKSTLGVHPYLLTVLHSVSPLLQTS